MSHRPESHQVAALSWENRPQDSDDVVWRYSGNPVIPRNATTRSNSIFNSAVVPFNGAYAGVFRCDDRRRYMNINRGFSDDGIHWRIDADTIRFHCDDAEVGAEVYRYDPRVCWIEDRYYITWCNGYHVPTIGVGYTYDFDTTYWGKHRSVMQPSDGWQSTKVGAGPTPFETDEGWLLFYHGVLTSCNGFVYSFGAALLDLDQLWKVAYRTEPYLMSPQMLYEYVGDVPNVVFPCAALADEPTGRIAIYYGAADTVTGLAFCYLDEVVAFVKTNSLV